MVVVISEKNDKEIIGLVEEVTFIGKNKSITVPALFDTGATRTSIDSDLAKELELGPIKGEVNVKSKTSGTMTRYIVSCKMKIKDKLFEKDISLSNRKDMFTRALIGRDIIHDNFIIDVSLSHNSEHISDIKEKR